MYEEVWKHCYIHLVPTFLLPSIFNQVVRGKGFNSAEKIAGYGGRLLRSTQYNQQTLENLSSDSTTFSPHWDHDDVIKWKHFPRYWPFVRGIHRSPVNCTYKCQWGGALKISLICAWINGWVNNREAGDSRRHCTHYDVTVMRRNIINKLENLSPDSTTFSPH